MKRIAVKLLAVVIAITSVQVPVYAVTGNEIEENVITEDMESERVESDDMVSDNGILELEDEMIPPVGNDDTKIQLSNPRIASDSSTEEGQKTTYDCVWFGSYPQSEITESARYGVVCKGNKGQDNNYIVNRTLYENLSKEEFDSDDMVVVEDVKYKRLKIDKKWHYFKCEPIKWRILAVDENKATLMADKCLDGARFENTDKEATWEDSSVRKFLNNDFYNLAFNATQKDMIEDTVLRNLDSDGQNKYNGKDTTDKVFLLSAMESTTVKYGFREENNRENMARATKATTYACARCKENDCCSWWLRTIYTDKEEYKVLSVDTSGNESGYGAWQLSNSGKYTNNTHEQGIRPVVTIDASRVDQTMWAGIICSDGTIKTNGFPGEKIEGEDGVLIKYYDYEAKFSNNNFTVILKSKDVKIDAKMFEDERLAPHVLDIESITFIRDYRVYDDVIASHKFEINAFCKLVNLKRVYIDGFNIECEATNKQQSPFYGLSSDLIIMTNMEDDTEDFYNYYGDRDDDVLVVRKDKCFSEYKYAVYEELAQYNGDDEYVTISDLSYIPEFALKKAKKAPNYIYISAHECKDVNDEKLTSLEISDEFISNNRNAIFMLDDNVRDVCNTFDSLGVKVENNVRIRSSNVRTRKGFPPRYIMAEVNLMIPYQFVGDTVNTDNMEAYYQYEFVKNGKIIYKAKAITVKGSKNIFHIARYNTHKINPGKDTYYVIVYARNMFNSTLNTEVEIIGTDNKPDISLAGVTAMPLRTNKYYSGEKIETRDYEVHPIYYVAYSVNGEVRGVKYEGNALIDTKYIITPSTASSNMKYVRVSYTENGITESKYVSAYKDGNGIDIANIVDIHAESETDGFYSRLDKDEFEYTGEAVYPKVSLGHMEIIDVTPENDNYEGDDIYSRKKTKLKENVDYVVDYQNNIDVGVGTAVICGMGGYTGVIEEKFYIKPRKNSNVVIAAIENVKYTGGDLSNSIKSGIYVMDKDKVLTNTDYEITINGETTGSTGKDTEVNFTVTLISGNYVPGKKLTGKVSILGSADVIESNKLVVTAKKPLDSVVYNGKFQRPSVDVTYGGVKLKSGKDYSVIYLNNRNVGKAEIRIIGKNKYYGRKTLFFNIKPKSFSTVKVKIPNKYEYSPVVQNIPINIKDGKVQLMEGIDYEIIYPNMSGINFDSQKQHIVKLTIKPILGKNYNSETISVDVTLVPRSLKRKVLVDMEELEEFEYDPALSEQFKPEVIVYYGNYELEEGKDYTVIYGKNNKPGKGKVVITGKGYYSGKITKKFNIYAPEKDEL